ARPADHLLLRAPGDQLRGRCRLRHRGLRPVVPGAARPRGVPAAVPVRGLVPVTGPRPRPRHSHRDRGRRGFCGVAAMSLAALREALLDQGGTIAESLGSAGASDAAPGAMGAGAPQLAAGGPRAAGRERDYELLLEMILEGSLLHYGAPRL